MKDFSGIAVRLPDVVWAQMSPVCATLKEVAVLADVDQCGEASTVRPSRLSVGPRRAEHRVTRPKLRQMSHPGGALLD
ncbi:MAG: hypothetical protein AAF458_22015 [Pseudomonadota bacterium]